MRPQKYLMVTVVMAVCIICLSSLPLKAAIRENLAQPYEWVNPQQLALSWSEIGRWFRRQRVPGGSRGPFSDVKVCGILPGLLETDGGEESERRLNKVWNPNPVFVWQGEWETLTVNTGRRHEVILSQALTLDQQILVYDQVADAKPLEPGKAYYWRIENSEFKGDTPFRTMDVDEYAEVAAALQTLEAELRLQHKSEDDILRERVGFFLERDLAADAFREIYLAPNPPEDLVRVLADIQSEDFCENFAG